LPVSGIVSTGAAASDDIGANGIVNRTIQTRNIVFSELIKTSRKRDVLSCSRRSQLLSGYFHLFHRQLTGLNLQRASHGAVTALASVTEVRGGKAPLSFRLWLFVIVMETGAAITIKQRSFKLLTFR
jgi:hypothetical protein